MGEEWNGKERRSEPHECTQVDNIRHIQDDVANHKVWRKETTKLLENINIQLATMNDRLKTKMDDDEKKDAWVRNIAICLISTFAISIFTAVYAYGSLNKQVEINTDRWNKVLSEQHQ